MPIVCCPGAVLQACRHRQPRYESEGDRLSDVNSSRKRNKCEKRERGGGWEDGVLRKRWRLKKRRTLGDRGEKQSENIDRQRGKGKERKRRRERNSATSDSLSLLGQVRHTSPVTRDWGRHVSSQIGPQTHWQGLSAERGERLFLANSHARVNHWQLQRGGAIKRSWWRCTGVCGLRYSGVISHHDSNQPFLKCWKSVCFNPGESLCICVNWMLRKDCVCVRGGGR